MNLNVKIGEKKAERRSTRSANLNETQKLEFDAKPKVFTKWKKPFRNSTPVLWICRKNLSNQSRWGHLNETKKSPVNLTQNKLSTKCETSEETTVFDRELRFARGLRNSFSSSTILENLLHFWAILNFDMKIWNMQLKHGSNLTKLDPNWLNWFKLD